jgi:hypothetical protein
VTRRNTGFPHIITILVTYPSTAARPSLPFLCKRVEELQVHFPLLRCRIIDDRTREPAFQLSETWTPEQVIRTWAYTSEDELKDQQEAILGMECSRTGTEGLNDPLWQVGLYDSQSDRRGHLALSVDHALTDGKGVQQLIYALLMESIEHLPFERLETIPRLEDTVNLHPKLPASIPSDPPWPTQQASKPSTECPSALSVIHLPTSLVDRLKVVGKTHDCPTLHPVLLLSLAVSIWSIVSPSQDPLPLIHATPVSVRDPNLGHAYCTANYTANCGMKLTITRDLDFWSEASRIGLFLRSPEGRDTALSAKGQLASLPDSLDPNRPDEFPTGWEEVYLTKARSDRPYTAALGVSNLGMMKLPGGAEDVVWSQMVSPFAPVLLVCMNSCEKGLRAVGGWREGCVLERKDVKRIEVVWEVVLGRLADGWAAGSVEKLVG